MLCFDCIVTRGAIGARVWEVWVCRHADVLCVCLVYILWQFSMLHSACLLQFVNAGQVCKKRPYGRGILQSQSHDCIIGRHECLLLFTPSCWCKCVYHL